MLSRFATGSIVTTKSPQLLDQIQRQSDALLTIYKDATGQRLKEVQQIGSGDPFDEFYRQVSGIREHHARYPNEQAENSELRYRNSKNTEDGPMPYLVDSMFSGEEGVRPLLRPSRVSRILPEPAERQASSVSAVSPGF